MVQTEPLTDCLANAAFRGTKKVHIVLITHKNAQHVKWAVVNAKKRQGKTL